MRDNRARCKLLVAFEWLCAIAGALHIHVTPGNIADAFVAEDLEHVQTQLAFVHAVTQQNAALIEEAAAAGSLQDLASSLSQVLSVFNLGGIQTMSSATAEKARGTPLRVENGRGRKEIATGQDCARQPQSIETSCERAHWRQ